MEASQIANHRLGIRARAAYGGWVALVLAALLLAPPRATAQCANIAGNWNYSETGTVTLVLNASDGETANETDPVSGTGNVTITSTGTCTFQYTPIPLNGSALLNANLTPSQLASLARTVTVTGNNVEATGIFAVLNTAAAAQEGLAVTGDTPNVYTATGQVTTNPSQVVMTLNGTGNLVVSGSEQGISFTLTISAATTATLTKLQQLQIIQVDPVPNLLCGQPAVISATSMCGSNQGVDLLATQGTVVQGVGADGVTELVLRVSGLNLGDVNAGDTLTFTLLNDQGEQSVSPTDDGALGQIGDTNFNASQVSTMVVNTSSSGPMAFAVYRAPMDFPRTNPPANPGSCHGVPSADAALPCRTVSIQVQDLTTGMSGIATVTIVRPPVMLVHGNWSSPADWTFFNTPGNAIVSGNCTPSDPRFHVYCLDYSTTMRLGIASNSQLTLLQLIKYLQTFKTQAGVAAVQADVVGYSMGGLIARDWVAKDLSKPFIRVTNFNQGDVHKLITIDTPHLGSQEANYLLASNNVCKTVFNLSNSPVGQNIIDLAVGSSLLQALSSVGNSVHLPTQVVVGTANGFQLIDANTAYAFGVISVLCPGLLPPGGYLQLFSPPISYNSNSGASDLVVPEYSQMAQGLGIGSAINAIPVPEGVVHTVNAILFPLGPDVLNGMLDSTGKNRVQANPPVSTPTLVINALNTPVSSFQPIAP